LVRGQKKDKASVFKAAGNGKAALVARVQVSDWAGGPPNIDRTAGIANATLTFKVIVRGSEHFLECRGVGEFKGALPSTCRPGEELERVTWPPESSMPARKG
jgi:hypothetical protein